MRLEKDRFFGGGDISLYIQEQYLRNEKKYKHNDNKVCRRKGYRADKQTFGSSEQYSSSRTPRLFKSGKKKYTDEELRKIMSDCDTPVLVAADDKDRVLGYAFCIFQQHRDSHILTDIKTLYIDDLCVVEGQRGNGDGKVI